MPNDEVSRTLGVVVRGRRLELGLTQAQLAERIGVTDSHVAYIEMNKRRPSDELLAALGKELGIDLSHLPTGPARARSRKGGLGKADGLATLEGLLREVGQPDSEVNIDANRYPNIAALRDLLTAQGASSPMRQAASSTVSASPGRGGGRRNLSLDYEDLGQVGAMLASTRAEVEQLESRVQALLGQPAVGGLGSQSWGVFEQRSQNAIHQFKRLAESLDDLSRFMFAASRQLAQADAQLAASIAIPDEERQPEVDAPEGVRTGAGGVSRDASPDQSAVDAIGTPGFGPLELERLVRLAAGDTQQAPGNSDPMPLHRPLVAEGSKDWQERAACSQVDPEAFPSDPVDRLHEAKQVCRRCPVKEECLAYALKNHEQFGIWGGLTERERRRLKKRPG